MGNKVFVFPTACTRIVFRDSYITRKKFGIFNSDMFCLYMDAIFHLLASIQVCSMFLLNSVRAKDSASTLLTNCFV